MKTLQKDDNQLSEAAFQVKTLENKKKEWSSEGLGVRNTRFMLFFTPNLKRY